MRYIAFLLICIIISPAIAFAGETPSKWWGASPPSAFMIYIVNPDALAGWPAKLYPYEVKFIPEKYKKLPVLGSWHEGGGIPDKEMLVKYKIKKAFMITSLVHTENRFPEIYNFGMEVHTLKGLTLNDYIFMLRELGKKLDVASRGEELAQYAESALQKSAAMSKGITDKPRVYVAENNDGLTTSCNFETLDIAGGINVFKCPESVTKGFTQISFEQVMLMDPDVVVIANPFFAEKFKDDKKWRRLRAYKEGRVYVVPFGPFGWMDKPAVMNFIAVQWLSCKLHPDKCAVDMEDETKRFMKLFLHLDLNATEIKTILYR